MRHVTAILALSLSFAAAACETKAPSATAAPLPVESAHAATSAFVTHFNASAGELPEGLLVTSDAAFVGFAPSSKVVRVDTVTGAATPFGQLPPPTAGKGFMTGLAQSASGEIYAGLASFVPEVQAGIYRIPKGGGASTLFAKDAALPFPNALAVDTDGSLWVTDSATGSVFRIDGGGHAERWASGELLTGKKYTCGAGLGPGFDIGANGLVVERDAVYVVNTDKATLVKIPREASGKAGAARIFAGPDCANLGGADGLARAPDGSFIVALNRQDKLARVDSAGAAETVASGAPFDFPASVAYRGSDLYITNFALANAMSGKPAAPGLLKINK